jgi:D-lactate dehydrogenase (cytochrome)
MAREHGRDALETMRAIKDTLDPKGTLNPGKIVPDEG